jgi:uncharacterized phiE125 gp8 family phage protein
MKIQYKTISKPHKELITLREAKLYLRVMHDREDELISSMIQAVRVAAENYLSKSLAMREWQLIITGDLPQKLQLLHGPVVEIKQAHVVLVHETQRLSLQHYHLDLDGETLHLSQYLMAEQVVVNFSAGYGDENLPESIKQAMLIHLAHLYDGRGDECSFPLVCLGFYKQYREIRI